MGISQFFFEILPSSAQDSEKEYSREDTVYVIQIVKTYNLELLKSVGDKLKSINPDKEIILFFKSPYHYVNVGYFTSKQEAEEYQKIIKEDFPDTIILPRVPSKK